jgi:uncharacterized membrane protein
VYHDQSKATVLIPITFFSLAATTVWSYLTNLIDFGFDTIVDIIEYAPIPLLLNIAFAVFCVLAALDALKGLARKKFLFIALALGGLIASFSLTDVLCSPLVKNFKGFLFNFFVLFAGVVASIALYAAWFFFVFKSGLTSKEPLYAPIQKSASNFQKQSDPAQELKDLNEKYVLGEITEEEYNARRAEIISRI